MKANRTRADSVRKSKWYTKVRVWFTPTRIYFEIYMYLRAQCGVSLHTSEPSIGDILPDVKGLRENFEGGEDDTRQKACYMKSHNAEILAFSKA